SGSSHGRVATWAAWQCTHATTNARRLPHPEAHDGGRDRERAALVVGEALRVALPEVEGERAAGGLQREAAAPRERPGAGGSGCGTRGRCGRRSRRAARAAGRNAAAIRPHAASAKNATR